MATEETKPLPKKLLTPASMTLEELKQALEEASSLEEWLTLVRDAANAGLVEEISFEMPSAGSRTIWKRGKSKPLGPDE